ncbi:unnamed protein product [Linum trigynum]|uniref:Uncharacterized protein n=1 Tax=Linum trigynum TaxID=586398 RepID=A0AAV2GNL4_9ROSI
MFLFQASIFWPSISHSVIPCSCSHDYSYFHDLRRFLHIPAFGEALAHPAELPLFNFDVATEAVHLTGHEPYHDLTFSSALLLPLLQTFHYLLSRVFLPRSIFLDRVIPLDLWILAHVVAAVPLDFSHLLFGALLPFIDHNFHDPLPFGAMITRLLLALPLDLSAYHTESPTQWLNADEVLNEIGNAIEGEDDGPFIHWISSDSELEDEAEAGEESVEPEAPEAPIAFDRPLIAHVFTPILESFEMLILVI